MDDYLQELYECIISSIAYKTGVCKPGEIMPCSASLHKLVHEIKDQSSVTLNFNEEGRLHSKYLGDRYEPAVIVQRHNSSIYYYLFDGEIKDCIHPFSVEIYAAEKYIEYYSSERIKQELPIYIREEEFILTEIYNEYFSKPMLAEYKHGKFKIKTTDYQKKNYFLHYYMELALPFKFAD